MITIVFFNVGTTWAFLFNISSCYSASHSTPLMMKSGYLNIGELVHILSDQGRQNIVTALDVAMPAPSFFDRYTVDVLFDQI